MLKKESKRFLADKIGCPNCGNDWTKVVCGYREENKKIRRRKCRECGHTLKTIQTIEPEVGKENIVPFFTEAEKRERRRASPRHTKLTALDVMQIKYFASKKSFPLRELAFQYGVEKGCISSIIRGQSWKDIPTPSELP